MISDPPRGNDENSANENNYSPVRLFFFLVRSPPLKENTKKKKNPLEKKNEKSLRKDERL